MSMSPPLTPPTAFRGVDVPPFYTNHIAQRAAELREQGRAIIPMHFGAPTAGTPPAVRQAAALALADDPNGYVESRELIERISSHYRDAYQLEVAPSRIQLTAGASAGLVAAFAALFHPGDSIAVGRPGYPAYRNAMQALGRRTVEIDLDAASGYQLTGAHLDAVPDPLHGLLVASPANPTGAMLDTAGLDALATRCRARAITLISDEIYHGISYGERAICALEVDDNAIVINSFSKLFRMPGWRLGWMVVPEVLAPRLSAYVINCFLTPPALAQRAALAAFDDPAELAAAVDVYRVNRHFLLTELSAAGIAGIVAPQGAFYLYLDVAHLTDDSLSFCLRLLEDTGVAAAPGLDFDPIGGHGSMRLSFAVSAGEAARAAVLLRDWFALQPRR
ncbi:MAG: aminotransferase class I/II-fold pyridoxal phosphate-dependent enzyme [Pseudomonadota bacterium]